MRLNLACAILEFAQNSNTAALPATRLKNEILKALTVKNNHVYIWTGSTTVLQWLNSNDKLRVFIANRVGEILESVTIDEWRHVLSGDNPADTDTRGISSEALRIAAGLLVQEFSGLLIGHLNPTNM